MNALVPIDTKVRPVQFSEEDGLLDSMHQLKDLLLRRKGSLLGCLGSCLLLAGCYLALTPSKYTASATLMLDGQHTDVIHQDMAIGDAQVLNAMAESQVEVLRSQGLARQVVDRLDLISDPMISVAIPGIGTDRIRERAAQQLLRMSSVKRVGMTYVIEVDVTAKSASEASRLANGIASTYLAMQAQMRGDTTRQAADWLSQQLDALRQRALRADEAVQSFKAANGIVETDKGSLDQEQVATLDAQLLAATARTAQAKARVDRLTAIVRATGVLDGGMSDVVQDPVLTTLEQHYFELAERQAELSARYGRSHAIVLKLGREMADIQGSIRQELARTAAAAQSDLAVAQASEATIRAQLAELVDQSGVKGAARAKLRSLESSAAIYRTVYSSSLQHYAQSVQDASFPVVAAHVVSVAEPPLTKSKPRRSLVVLGSAVFGVAVGVALALLLEFLDETLISSSQVERELGVGCLGRLPRLVHRRSVARSEIRLTNSAARFPHTMFAREIRRVRLRVLQSLGDGRSGVVGVVASRSGDGASAVAHNLAEALMGEGRSVGILSLQSSGSGRPHVARSDETSTNALVHMSSATAGDLLRRLQDLRALHDVLVLDLPQMFDVEGADEVLRMLNCVVLVARCGQTRSRELMELVNGIGLDWARVAGVVLNCSGQETIGEGVH